MQTGQTEKLTAPTGRGNPPCVHTDTTAHECRAGEHRGGTAPRRASSPLAQTQTSPFERLQANPCPKSHPAASRRFQNVHFSQRKGSTISGAGRGPQQKSVKPASHTAPLFLPLHEIINSICRWLPLPRPSFITQPQKPTLPHRTPEPHGAPRCSARPQPPCYKRKKTNLRCALAVLSSNPSNLEGIGIEMWKKAWKLRRTLLRKEVSSLWNTKLYFPPKAVEIEN